VSETYLKPIRVELVSRDAFWRKAVMVEWNHQFPDRTVTSETGNIVVLDEAWIEDFSRAAERCFSTVVAAPADPSRRRLFRRLLAIGTLR
jgi:hypothetical protein